MKKGINTDKIIRYAGTASLVFSLSVGASIAIDDVCVDHTQEVCRLGQIMTSVVHLQNDTEITRGMIHQMVQMQKEYEEKGINVTMAYEPSYEDVKYTTTEEKVLPIEVKKEDGTISYVAPVGYELKLIDGEYWAVKIVTTATTEKYEAFVAYDKDKENNFTGKSYALRIR